MTPLRILMLEDSPLDATLILKTLSFLTTPFECIVVSTEPEFKEKLEHEYFDVILSDYQLPGFDAVGALHIRNQIKTSLPFILVTGAVSEEVAINMVKEGATDYVLKDRLQRLPLAIEKAVNKQQLKFDKQNLETSLSELTERFQIAARTSFDVIWDFDFQKNELYCSAAIEKLVGTGINEKLEPSFLKKFIHPEDLSSIEQSFRLLMKSREHRWRKIFRVIRSDGFISWVNSNAMILRNKNDEPVRVVGVVHDITEVRKLQHELIEQQVRNQREIAKITLQAQEKERMEIGRELHDNVNQLLATAKIMIDTAKNIPDMHDLCLAKSQESIMEAINELRNLAHAMMPPPFENNDFENILNDLVYKINLSRNLSVHLSLPGKEKLADLNNGVKLALYRIMQEQLSNVLKHAAAKNVFIEMVMDDAQCTLIIQDDGRGFDAEKRSKGIGLKNIESRCNLLKGVMTLVTAPGEGCLMKISIPSRNTIYV